MRMIIQEKENNNVVPFGTLEAGEVFKNGDGCFLMKTKASEHYSDYGPNAVYLDHGIITSFLDNTIVVRANGRFVEE